MKFGRGLFGWVLFVALAGMLIFLLAKKNPELTPIPFGNFLTMMETKLSDGADELTSDVPGPITCWCYRWISKVSNRTCRTVKFELGLPSSPHMKRKTKRKYIKHTFTSFIPSQLSQSCKQSRAHNSIRPAKGTLSE